jgi:hypothetical protein
MHKGAKSKDGWLLLDTLTNFVSPSGRTRRNYERRRHHSILLSRPAFNVLTMVVSLCVTLSPAQNQNSPPGCSRARFPFCDFTPKAVIPPLCTDAFQVSGDNVPERRRVVLPIV